MDKKYIEEQIKIQKRILNDPNCSRHTKRKAQGVLELAETKLRRLMANEGCRR